MPKNLNHCSKDLNRDKEVGKEASISAGRFCSTTQFPF